MPLLLPLCCSKAVALSNDCRASSCFFATSVRGKSVPPRVVFGLIDWFETRHPASIRHVRFFPEGIERSGISTVSAVVSATSDNASGVGDISNPQKETLLTGGIAAISDRKKIWRGSESTIRLSARLPQVEINNFFTLRMNKNGQRLTQADRSGCGFRRPHR